jgi:hypothetical protein
MLYNSHGDIYQLSPIVATLYAMIAKVHSISLSSYENPLAELTKDEVPQKKKDEEDHLVSISKSFNRMSVSVKSLFDDKDKGTLPKSLDAADLKQSVGLATATDGAGMFDEDVSNTSTARIFHIGTKSNRMKVAFLHKGGALIYMGLSKERTESFSYLKKQLEILHLQMIANTTQQIIKTLKYNPSYDVVNEF